MTVLNEQNPSAGKRVLIVDDEPMNTDMLSRRLESRGYATSISNSAAQALESLQENTPDVILLDVNMPRVSGLELLDQLRANEGTQIIPVILVSALADTDNIVRGLQRGANDYVTKPVNLPVLLARLETQLKMASLVSQLESQKEALARLASRDDLTGVLNRRAMFETLDVDLARSSRYNHPLSLLMMDLDHFKRVNDDYGHAAGDAVLRHFAKAVGRSLRSTDSLCRYGGEEFCAILPETGEEQARRAAELIRELIEQTEFVSEGTKISLTVSIGIGIYTPPADTGVTELLDNADKALYEAKENGRNRVEVYREGQQPQPLAATG